MSEKNDLEPRIAAIETCLVHLMVEHFRASAKSVAALDRFDRELQAALQAVRAAVIETAAQRTPEETPEAIERMVDEEIEPQDAARLALLARVRKLLLQG